MNAIAKDRLAALADQVRCSSGYTEAPGGRLRNVMVGVSAPVRAQRKIAIRRGREALIEGDLEDAA